MFRGLEVTAVRQARVGGGLSMPLAGRSVVKREMVEAHVERLLERITGDERLERDQAGDWPFTRNRSMMYVTINGDKAQQVAVYAVAAHSVPADSSLFELLNTINNQISYSRAFWTDSQVLVAAEMVAESLDIEELQTALDRVAAAADRFGPQVVELCGGQTPRPDHPDEPSPAKVTPGYL